MIPPPPGLKTPIRPLPPCLEATVAATPPELKTNSSFALRKWNTLVYFRSAKLDFVFSSGGVAATVASKQGGKGLIGVFSPGGGGIIRSGAEVDKFFHRQVD